MRIWTVVAGGILFVSLVSAKTTASTTGEILYLKGILPSGESLKGTREAGVSAEGETAACVNCHRRSGLGTVEGRIVIPPIISKYLFHPTLRSVSESNTAHGEPAHRQRSAYTEASLARAIREGIDADGHTMDYLMPRYELDDAAMASLIEYLKGLSRGRIPGVTADTLHFATIITPDADPVKRKGMLDVLEHFFAANSTFYRGEAPPLQSSQRMMFRVLRKWQLHVCELAGAPATWLKRWRSC